jgi:hypothetical protein
MMDGSYLQAGYTAARTGSDFMSCPHPLGSDVAIQWMIGHWVWQLEQGHANAGLPFVWNADSSIPK